MRLKSLLFCFVLISCKLSCLGQEGWPSPELEQMYSHIQEYKRLGNYKDATTTLKQLINLAPGKTRLKTELGDLYYLAGDYEHGEETLAALLKEAVATDTTYQLLAACQLALGKNKQAIKTTEKGLILSPNSGMLHYRRGAAYLQASSNEGAMNAWQEGIVRCPNELLNYAWFAKLALQNNRIMWGLIYGETYLCMTKDTIGNDSLKHLIYNGWKAFFTELSDPKVHIIKPGYFKDFYSTYQKLTPVVSDGISTENLTMVRTRFLMKPTLADELPLFRYHDDLVRNGWFDIYNEWLFGKTENETEYAAWNKFHSGDMARFETWRAEHLLQPKPADALLPYKDESTTEKKNVKN